MSASVFLGESVLHLFTNSVQTRVKKCEKQISVTTPECIKGARHNAGMWADWLSVGDSKVRDVSSFCWTLCFILMLVSASFVLWAQPPTQPSKEYIYLGNRLLVTEEPVNNTTPVPPLAGITHWWTGDEDAKDFVPSDQANGIFMNGATIVPGKVGNAFSFDGVDDYVDIPSINIGNTFSLEFWMYPMRQNSGYLQFLVANSDASANFGTLSYSNTNLYYSQGSSVRIYTPSNTIPLNTWSHVALTYDGAVTRIYVNGVLKVSSGQHTMTFNNPLRLGHDFSTNPYTYYKGLLDEVSLYNRALTADEIAAIYNAGGSGKSKFQFSITTSSLPVMYVGSAATTHIETSNGTSPITFGLSSGSLPDGVTLTSTGEISGIPILEGTFNFTVQATDVTNATTSRVISATVLLAITPPPGLADWWPGDIDASDLVGTNHGTFFNGANSSAAGKVAGAFSFDGTNDYVQLPAMNIGNLFSLEFWVYPTRSGSNQYLIFNSLTGSNFGALSFSDSYVGYSAPGGFSVRSPANSVPLNTWSHIALTYDGAVVRLYVNGLLQGTSGQHTITFSNPLKLGSSGNYYFQGMLDEISLYNRALMADEILAIYNAGSNGKRKP